MVCSFFLINLEGFKATNYHFISEEELLIVVENQSRLATCPHCQKTREHVRFARRAKKADNRRNL
jgi:hypothetical protein